MTLTAGRNINTQSLDSYSKSTFGTGGNGGGMTLTAGGDIINTLTLDSSSQSNSGTGNGGDITIKISEGNILIAYISSFGTGQGGNGGTIQLTGDKLDLNGIVINSDGKNGSNSGLIKLDSPWIQLTNSYLSSSSYGSGKFGQIELNSTGDINLNHSRLFTTLKPGSTGQGGNIEIKAQNLNLTNYAVINTGTDSSGNAGDIKITAENVSLKDGSSVRSLTTDQGNAGNITMKTNFLKLDNADITAESAGGNGGNIKLITGNLLLRHNSEISTTAGSTNTPGNGGQITINAKNGYIVAFPTEDSDIVANAFGGNGGKIDISAIRVLGLETRGRLNTAQLQTIRTNNTSDIAASSDIAVSSDSDLGTDGTVAIQSLGINPSQGLVAIPVNLVDPSGSGLIAQDCNSNNSNSDQSQSEFVITGRGGLPPSPDDMLTAGALPAKWVTRGKGDRAILPIGIVPTTAPLIEAQGMVRNANGDIVLIAQPVISTNFRSGLSSQLCRITKNQHKL